MKILVVLPRFPYPLEKGDKLRAYHQIRVLSENNDIYLFALSHENVSHSQIEKLKPYCRQICVVRSPKLVNYKNIIRNFLYIKSLQIGFWDSRRARKKYRAFEQQVQPDVVYSQMVRTMTIVAHSTLPKVMDFQDALSMNTERRMDRARNIWRHILHFEFKMLRSSEFNSFDIFDDLTIISQTDSEAIPHYNNDKIHIIPNGVDFDFFVPRPDATVDYDVVYCGNMSYEPNVSAVTYLINNVMPIVWAVRPDTRVLIAGVNPSHAIQRFHSKQVTVTGWIADIRDAYARAKMFVAPMQTGSGLQNKLLEAMAMERPCITSQIANMALHATPDSQILIGESPQQYADHILRLLSDETFSRQLAKSGRTFVLENYNWNRYGKKLEDVLRHAVESHNRS